jgi:hypothetical protein
LGKPLVAVRPYSRARIDADTVFQDKAAASLHAQPRRLTYNKVGSFSFGGVFTFRDDVSGYRIEP